MQLHELEVSNYKCLDNYGMPLKFSNLNVLIGQNDSGKTSLLELIQVIFGEKIIDSSFFYNKNKPIKIRVKLNCTEELVLKRSLLLEKFNRDYYRYISDLTRRNIPDLDEDFSSLDIDSSKWIEYLKSYNFYKDLKKLIKYCYENIDIIVDYIYKIPTETQYKEIKYLLKSPEQTNNSEEIIIRENAAYFFIKDDLRKKKLLKNLIEDPEFVIFMKKHLSIYYDKLKNIVSEIVNNQEKFSFSANSLLIDVPDDSTINFLEDWYSARKEKYLNPFAYMQKTDIDETNQFNFEVFNFVKSSYSSIIFSNDDEDDILSKTAYLISLIINEKNLDSIEWNLNSNLNINYGIKQYYYLKSATIPEFSGPEEPEKNIIENFSYVSLDAESNHLPKPMINTFDLELSKVNVPKKIFDDLASKEPMDLSKIDEDIKEKIEEFLILVIKKLEGKIFEKKVKSLENNLNLLTGQSKNKIIFNNFIKSIPEIKLDSKIFITEQGRKIDITKKGDGFIRKLLLADFLTLLEYPNLEPQFTIDLYEHDDDQLVLIEEPELHLHAVSQQEIMRIIKEKLKRGRNQLFITTHSHFIVEEVDFEQIYIFKKDNLTGLSKVTNIRQYEDNADIIKSLQDSLGISKTDILNLKKLIVLVEGKRDKELLESLCKRPELNINIDRILFFEVKGQDKMDDYVKSDLVTNFLEKRILIILDNNLRNIKRKERLLRDKTLDQKVRDNIIDIIVLQRVDILDYLDLMEVENYYNLPKGSLDKIDSSKKLEHILEKEKNIKIRDGDIEEIVIRMNTIDSELIDVLNKIKFLEQICI